MYFQLTKVQKKYNRFICHQWIIKFKELQMTTKLLPNLKSYRQYVNYDTFLKLGICNQITFRN